MAKGIKRSVTGVLLLALAGETASLAYRFNSMAPNEIADRMIKPQLRYDADMLKLAVAQREGPVFDVIKKSCERDEKNFIADKASDRIASYVPIRTEENKTFNMRACLDKGLEEKIKYARPVPAKGQADENYKQWEIEMSTKATFMLGAIGGVLLLSAGFSFVRRKQANDAASATPAPQ